MTNQLGKFTPWLADIIQALRELLNSKKTWFGMQINNNAFSEVKSELSQPILLTFKI